MNQKIIIYLILAAVVAAAIAGFFWLLAGFNPLVIYPSPPNQTKGSVEYTNSQYGFSFSLPQDWKGYSVMTDFWKGDEISQNGQVKVNALLGPIISLRNHLWTSEKPYQDIPIMIFTMQQWNDLRAGKFHIGAAPFNPSELGLNDKYVFALPARYNYAFLPGWQEVDQILKNNPLKPIKSVSPESLNIDSISPSSGTVGTNVVISGYGFTNDNKVLFDNFLAIGNIKSSVVKGRTVISFYVPSYLTVNCQAGQACPMLARQVTAGSYDVSVENQNGASNSAVFIVTGGGAVTKKAGEKELNFLIQKINNNNVDGLLYILYPVATSNGQPKTIQVGDMVGYECEGKTARVSNIDFESQTVTFIETVKNPPPYGCPICLASNTNISVLNGNKNVRDIKAGDLVWSLNKNGAKVLVPVLKISSVLVPSDHKVIDLILADGRQVFASPNHPTADGLPVGNLKAGDYYDGSIVKSAESIPYWDKKTYDILPKSDTKEYWANDILLKSTLLLP